MNEIPGPDWANFFVAEVGASAALTGLVVVAISINLAKILSYPSLPGRAAEALFALVGVLVLTSAALVPHQSSMLLGMEALLIGLVMFAAPLANQVRSLEHDTTDLKRHIYARMILNAATSLPIAVAGLLLILGLSTGLYWMAAGVILSLLVGVFTAWVLLIEILR